MKYAIIGAGGFGREVYHQMRNSYPFSTIIDFFVDDEYVTEKTLSLSSLNIDEYKVLVAVGDPIKRSQIVERLPSKTNYHTYIHPSAIICDPSITIGEGSIICAGCILTTNINIGKHAHLNLHTTIGHDCEIGDFFTTAPKVAISGNCKIGDHVYFGTNSCIKEKISICNDVTIGLNAGVVKDINVPGIYVGTPCFKK